MRNIINILRDDYKIMLILKYSKNMSATEITLKLNLSASQYHRNKQKIIKSIYNMLIMHREIQEGLFMKLVIAEKPSVAMEIGKVLGATEKENSCIKGNGYIISWCYGHLVGLAEPEYYNESYKKMENGRFTYYT